MGFDGIGDSVNEYEWDGAWFLNAEKTRVNSEGG